LKLVPKSETLMERSYAIKRILAHAAITDQRDKFDYYVQLAIPDSTPVWIAAEMFHENQAENLADNEPMESVGPAAVPEALCQPSTDLTLLTDRQAVVPLDAHLQTDRQAVVPLDAHLQTDRQAVVPLDANQAVKPAKRKPSWSYEDINVPAPRDITSSTTNKRTR
jgi:hypothetical protein